MSEKKNKNEEEMVEDKKEEKRDVDNAVNTTAETKAETGKEIKENNKTRISANGILAIVVIIILLAFSLVAFILWTRQPKETVTTTETTAKTTPETTMVEETGKITYEEFKKELEELIKKSATMSSEEFKKEIDELLMKLSTEDLLRASDYIDGRIAQKAMMTTTTETTKSEETAAAKEISETVSWGWKTEWYRSPFREITKQLKDELTWETFAEPGIFPGLDGIQTRWNDFSAEETPMLVPEGGWLYFATGSYKLWLFDSEKNEITDFLFAAPAAKERIYLTIVKGLPADGEDLDLNRIVMATDYVRGAGTYHDMPTASYVSMNWFEQQIEAAREESPGIESPNVGDNGAEEVIVVIIDLETQTVRVWKVVGPGDWQRVDENYF